MPGNLINSSGKPYLRIVGGNLVQKVDKDTPNARHREYELPNGTKGEKWELAFMNWNAKILGITFKETEYGEDCVIDLEDAILTLPVASRYFSDFACKIFSGDIKKSFLFHPYDIEGDNGRKTGISLQQDGEKLKNFFYDGEKNLHGFPEPDEEKKVKKSYWKIYFTEVAEFLIDKLKELEFTKPEIEEDETPENTVDEDIKIDDLPF